MINDLYNEFIQLFDGDKEEIQFALNEWQDMLNKDDHKYEVVDSEEFGRIVCTVE